MGLRFYRRLRIAPGLSLNLSKRGPSVSVGERGAHFTIGPHGTRETVGLPGTGISYTAVQHRNRRRRARTSAWGSAAFVLFIVYVLGYMALQALGIVGG
jgi:hypothetical protein